MTKHREPTPEERLGIILEDMRSQFRVVADGVLDANRKLNALDQRIDNVEENVEKNFLEIRALKKDVNMTYDVIKFTLSDHEHRIKKLEVV